MSFRKYNHVERLAHPDVDGIDIGTVHIFPKIDGTNASVWLSEEGNVQCGSRRRQISIDDDNAGFCAWVHEIKNLDKFVPVFLDHPSWILYGEWLVPHTLRTYRPEAWRKLYVFDVYCQETKKYVSYEEYAPVLIEAQIDIIDPIYIATNPTSEQLTHWLESNNYLIQDGEGAGEGIVLKNYSWENTYGRQPWAKIVRGEFKEKSKRAMGFPNPDGGFQVELAAVETFLTYEMVNKTLWGVVFKVSESEKVIHGMLPEEVLEKYRGKVIPQLLGTVYHDFVTEEIWAILRKWKACTIDFKRLNTAVVQRTKELLPEVF